SGIAIAEELEGVDLLILDGSGASFPPVKVDAEVLVIPSNHPVERIRYSPDVYRVRRADLVIMTFCEESIASKDQRSRLKRALRDVNPDLKVVETTFHPKCDTRFDGKRVFFATTA